MKKLVLRLLALVLVLCMVVPCMPVGALAVDLTRPENISDAEWEVLRQQLLAQLAEEQAAAEQAAKEAEKKAAEAKAAADAAAEAEKAAAEQAAKEAEEAAKQAAKATEPTYLDETDKLTVSKDGNLVVTDEADAASGVTAEKQTVSVELPAKADTIKTEPGTDDKDVITNEYVTTIGGKPDVAVEESYDLNADITAVETEGTGDKKNVTDITYNISLDGSMSAEDKDGKVVVKNDVVEDIDVKANQGVEEANKDPKTDIPEPQYKVDMSVNGMDSEEITRVEHKYTNTDGDDKVEYYYNAKNGTEDTTKKYFSIVEKVKEGTANITEKVVSLWTSLLGVFHITTDAFEGKADDQGVKASYGSLTEANTAEADSVEMLRDYETNKTATISNNMTVDLNDKKYTNTSDKAAIEVAGEDKKVTIQHGDIISNGDGILVSGESNKLTIQDGDVISNGDGILVSGENSKLSLWDVLVRSNADNDSTGNTAAVQVTGSGNTVNIEGRSWIDGTRSTYGVYSKGKTNENTVNISKSKVEGKTGVSLANSSALLSDSILRGTSGAALAVDGNTKANDVVITGGRFESGKDVANIYAKDEYDIASITVKGGRYTKPAGLYSYIPYGYALISHNDGSYFLYEVVGTDYTPTRDGYAFQGYTDANGKAISLKEAFRKGIIAYAQWKEIPETETKQVPLITVKTDEKGCTTKVIFKGDTAFVTVKDAKGELAPISEVVIPSIKRLQNKKIDTVEIQVDEDVSLVLDIEKAKENGFTDIVEVMLEKDMLLITSGQDTCIELDIAELKEADKPVTIQLVEGELTIMLGKNSSMTVDLTKALKTKERIVVKLESGVLKLYDKYHKPIKE